VYFTLSIKQLNAEKLAIDILVLMDVFHFQINLGYLLLSGFLSSRSEIVRDKWRKFFYM